VIGALLIDARSPHLRDVCANLATDVLTAGERLGWPEVGPLCGVYTPASEPCWRHWVGFRLEWAWVGLYGWPEYELMVVLGHVMDRLERQPEAPADDHADLSRDGADGEDGRAEVPSHGRDTARRQRPLSADALATRERWARWRQEHPSVA
jgi:hypothetical protein